ncbi:MAG TPA: hypothetical protein VHG72_12395 [Polyangia bacterium]|nr:hypothetical protein [Polyangia bacterium]
MATQSAAAPRALVSSRTLAAVAVAVVLAGAAAAKLRGHHVRAHLSALIHGKTAAAAATRAWPRSKPIIGYNMDFPGDWTEAIPFVDLMHDARPWEGGGAGDKYAGLDLDDHGWPKSLGPYNQLTATFRTEHADGFAGHVFVVSYRGEGTLSVQGTVQVLDQKPGQIRFRGADGNNWLSIDATDPKHTGDYLRDITIVREDQQALQQQGKIFNPELLAFLAPYHSIRFMDWAQSNEAGQEKAGRWSDRSKLTQPQWRQQFIDPRHPGLGLTQTGYPLEIQIAIANELHAHPHFNLPYKYDDGYARAFAKMVKEKLAPGLVATIEYSNEVWNWGFPQATYARLEAQKLWPGEGTGWLQFMGARASTMCRIFKDVFGAERQRLRCVIAPQTGWVDIADASLDCPKWVAMGHEPCFKSADAIAITGYFNGMLPRPENLPLIKKWLQQGQPYALAQAFRQLEKGDVAGLRGEDGPATPDKAMSVDNAVAAFAKWREIADQRGLALYAYEGGTHFDVGPDPELGRFVLAISNDPRMKDLYLRLFDGFAAAGGTVFNVWGGIARASSWANATSLNDRAHPKYRAVLEFEARQK